MKNHRAVKWGGGIVPGLVPAAVAAALFDWKSLRAPLARKASSSSGRSVAINGDRGVHLSLHLRVMANDVVPGNAAWCRDPTNEFPCS
jgi:uncharacterized protein involved in outer membrane biogenesis